jgi:hypothetical protein
VAKRPETGGLKYKYFYQGTNGYIPNEVRTFIRHGKFELPEWIVQLPLWQNAMLHAKKFLFNNLPDIPLSTFFPPFDTIAYAVDKTSAYLVRTVQLWPFIKARAILSRSDSNVSLLSRKEWRNILGKEYFQHAMWPKEIHKDYDASIFWKYGGPQVFGTALSDDIRAGLAVPRLG